MSHRILLTPASPVFSSALTDIPISVDGSFVDVCFYDTLSELLHERFYTFEAEPNISLDLRSIVEERMRQRSLIYETFTLDLLDADGSIASSVDFQVIYCDREVRCEDMDSFLSSHFLTTTENSRVSPLETALLTIFARAGESLGVTRTMTYRHGECIDIYTQSADLDRTALGDGIFDYHVDIPVLRQLVASLYDDPEQCELLSVTACVGDRSATFFVDPDLTLGQHFRFRNCFNAPQALSFPAVTTAKTAMEQSEAVIRERSQFYDRSASQCFEVTAGPLAHTELSAIAQVLVSHDVEHVTYSDGISTSQSVLISEFTCEISDADSELNSVKFSWRDAATRPALSLSEPTNPFSSPFNHSFL